MPDESTNNQSKKDDKRNSNNRGPQKAQTGASSTPGNGSRPGSGSGNRKPTSAPAQITSDPAKKQDNRNRGNNPSVSGPRGGAPTMHRKSPSGAPSNRNNQSPNTPPIQEQPSDALSSLQRVIADLKTTPAPQQSSGGFQPSNQGFNAGGNTHRKAASLGSQGQSQTGAFGSYAPHLGPMNEDAEDYSGNIPYDDGDSQLRNQPRGGAGFVAPRFAALAAQEDAASNAGRPQLAPGFHFGGQRAPGGAGLGPPINEEDLNFQFPQQQPKPAPEVSGIVAEQRAIQAQIESLQAHQAALYQQQLASGQVMSFQTPGLAPANRAQAHRRVQSNMPVGMGNFGGGVNQFNNVGGNMGSVGAFNTGNDGQNVPRGHGRRHSVNVVNKSAGGNSLSYPTPFQQDQYDDGFAPPSSFNPGANGGHSRQGSRVDNSWRLNGGAQGPGNNFGADLAQAQAQLQSLQQFRAAAGGHHQKMASFSFPNMLPNMMAANMMGLGLGGINLLQQQHQQFQSQLQQQSNQPQRKSLFAPYLPQASLPPLLAAGKLVVGILRVNKRNRSDAYVATEVLDADIYICGSKDRNRALEGDIVAVELLDVEEVWNTKREKEDKKRKKEENAAFESKTAAGRKDDKRKDDVEVEGQGLMLFEDEEVTDDVKPQFAGHVVAVVERMPGQLFSGTLGLLRPSSAATKEKQEAERREREGDRGDEPRRAPIERPKIVWFKPTDKRVPLIAIPTEQAPPDFVNNADAYVNHLFVACIKRHPISSLHPFGTLVEDLGPIGDVEVETSALLKDCNFPSEEFAENVIKCLPPMPFTIPEREYETRKDLRQERVFSIDPSTAKDIDDALHVKHNEDGTYEVGVHIADVSYFVKTNTALDREARKRATSVYLVQRAVPMLPPALSEDLCSLNPGVERLTMSFIFTLTADARVTNTWYGRTIIKSVAKLAYGQAQDVIEGQILNAVVSPEHNSSDVSHDIKALHSLATQLRARRFQDGALAFDSPKMKFELDEQGFPTDCAQIERDDANYLIEEFMLLANIAAAQQVAVNLPEQALLRRHDTPIERRLNAYVERAARLGYEMDTSSSGTLMKSFDVITDPTTKLILQLLSRKATQRARYFCAGMLDIAKYGHYALNLPLYTHFTSPIRRYSDIIVHRQLDAIISEGADKFPMDRDAVAKAAQQCNIKKDSARLAQEQSAHLFLCLLISDLTQRYGPVVRQAKVVGVLDAAFDVLVPEFGIEKRVHVDQMPINNHVYDQHTHTLQIYWSEKDVITWLAENSDDEHLKKVKQNAEQHAQAIKMEVNSRSHNEERALFDEDEEDDDDEILLGRSQKEQAQETSVQRLRSLLKAEPNFEGLRTTTSGHQIQEIKELMTVPVIVTADLTRSPPVIKVYSVNPYAKK